MSAKTLLVIGLSLLFLGFAKILSFRPSSDTILSPRPSPQPYWQIQSIDTMKYSRDLAREKLNDSSFDSVIDDQVRKIAETGAGYIAIATPYDEEFVPYLARWVNSARKYHLHVWFRGNFAGWEGWFGYKKISRIDHLDMTTKFVTTHVALFADGDLYTPCPECENGGPGDPRRTGDITGYQQFLIDLSRVSRDAFASINKKVSVGYHSMNYDVAMTVMDKPTTAAVGGVVAIDHYVKTPEAMVSDIEQLKIRSGGKIFLGEFGAPIPDINGDMTAAAQAEWLDKTLQLLIQNNSVIGLNYWVAMGGSTAIWDQDGNPKPAVSILTKYYSHLQNVSK